MKAFKVWMAMALIALMAVMPVFAAEATPSAERGDYEIIDWDPKEDCCDLIIIPDDVTGEEDFIDEDKYGLTEKEGEDLEKQIRDELKEALEDLKNNDLDDLIPGFDDLWDKVTGGAPIDNQVIDDVFAIVRICEEDHKLVSDEETTVSFTVDGIDKDDTFIVIEKPFGSDEWTVVEHKIDENGVITVEGKISSVFAIVTDSGKAPTSDVTSPQTGVKESGMAITLLAVALLAAGAVHFSKKLSKS